MVYSTVNPQEILITPSQQRLRWGITKETMTDEMTGDTYDMYVYHEAVFNDKTLEYLEEHKDAIIANPEDYNPIMLDGVYKNK